MILLASGSSLICRRWREALAGNFPLHQVSDRRGLLLSLQEHKPEIVFLDDSNGQFGPVSQLGKIIKAAPFSRVVILSATPDVTHVVALIKAGARGYASNKLSAPLLLKAAKSVLTGDIWIPRKFVPALAEELAGLDISKRGQVAYDRSELVNILNGLSPREQQVTSLVAMGAHNKLISNKLNVSEKTIKAHLTAIYRKLEVDGRTHLAFVVNRNLPNFTMSFPSVNRMSPAWRS
jgi:two-component system nitrate/nitrite response regulator NarL